MSCGMLLWTWPWISLQLSLGPTLKTFADTLARNIDEIALLEHLCQVELLPNLKAINVLELHKQSLLHH